MAPKYVTDLYELLNDDYNVQYFEEYDGEYTVCDCFILNGFCIKIDRLPVKELSHEDMHILLNSIRDIYIILVEKWKELGHENNPV